MGTIRVPNYQTLRARMLSGRCRVGQMVWVEGKDTESDGWQGLGRIEDNVQGRLWDNDRFILTGGTLAWVRTNAVGEGTINESVAVARVGNLAALRTRLAENAFVENQLVWIDGTAIAGDEGQGLGQVIPKGNLVDDLDSVAVGGSWAWRRQSETTPNTMTLEGGSKPLVAIHDYATLVQALANGDLNVGQWVLIDQCDDNNVKGGGLFQVFDADGFTDNDSSIFVGGDLAAVRHTGNGWTAYSKAWDFRNGLPTWMLLQRPSVGASIRQFDGSFVQPLPHEFGIEGGRRVENLALDSGWRGIVSASGTTNSSPVGWGGSNGANTSQIAHGDGSVTFICNADRRFFQETTPKNFVVGDVVFMVVEVVTIDQVTDLGQIITRQGTATFTVSGSISSISAPGIYWYKFTCTSSGTFQGRIGFGTANVVTGSIRLRNPRIYKGRRDQTIPDPEYVSVGVITGEFGDSIRAGSGLDPAGGFVSNATLSGNDVTLSSSGGSYYYMRCVPTEASTILVARITVACAAGTRNIGVRFAPVSGSGAAYKIVTVGPTPVTVELVVQQTAYSVLDIGLDNRNGIIPDGSIVAPGTFTVTDVTVHRMKYHGFGRDGVKWFKTDEYGNDLTLGTELGSELWQNGVPNTINDFDGSDGSFSNNSFINEAAGASDSYPRFSWTSLGIEVGKKYRVRIELNNPENVSATCRLAASGSANDIPEIVSNRIFSGDVVASASRIEFYFNGQTTWNIPLVSLSIREIINAGALGPELVTNGGLADGSDWLTTGTVTFAGGGANVTASGSLYQAGVVSAGKTFRVTYTISNYVSGQAVLASGSSGYSGTIRTADGTYTEDIKPTIDGNGYLTIQTSSSPNYTIDNISVREVYPVRAKGVARRPQITNLCPLSEDFTTWINSVTGTGVTPVKSGDLVTLNGGDGSLVGDHSGISVSVPGLTIGATYVMGLWIKAENASDVGKVVSFRGVAGSGYQNVTLTTNWKFASSAEVSIGTSVGIQISLRGTTGSSMGEVSFRAKVQVEAGSTTHDYIATAATAVTTTAETFLIEKALAGITDESSWLINHIPRAASTVNSNAQALIDLYTSSTERAMLYNRSGDLGTYVVDNNVAQWVDANAGAEWFAGVPQSVFWKVRTNQGSLVTGGVQRLTDTVMTVPTPDRIFLGSSGNGDAATYEGTFESIAFFEGTKDVEGEQAISITSGGMVPILDE